MDKIINDLLKKVAIPTDFFSSLHEIWLEERNKQEKHLPDLLALLNKDHNLDLCKIALDAINSGLSPFDACLVLEGSYSGMRLNVNSVIELSERY